MSVMEHAELGRECGTCVCYLDARGDCRRFPEFVSRKPHDWCHEHRFAPPSKEILETDLDLLEVKVRTRSVYRHCRLQNVDDLLVVGPMGVQNRFGRIDKEAVKDLRAALSRLGVEW